MNPLRADEIRGTWGTLLLPLNADDSIDFSRLRADIAAMADAGLAGIYSNGTAGEFHTQTEEEFDELSATLADECSRRALPFQLGVCQMSAQLSLARLRRVKSLAPGAVQVILPDWAAPTFEEAIAFLARMAEEAAPIGLVVYNPGHAKKTFTPGEWREVVTRVPGIVGMKVAGGDAAWYAQMKDVMAQVSVFVPGHTLATGRTLGAAGSYSNVACLSPRGAQRWFESMTTTAAHALETERRIQAFLKAHIIPLITEQKYSNTAIDKLLAHIGGWSKAGARLRWPYRSVPDEEARRLGEIAHQELPEDFWS